VSTDRAALSIWGSCVTRDTLEAGEHTFAALSYHARSSWLAQARGAAVPPVPVPEGAGFGERMVREDLQTSIVALLAQEQPHVLVLDLIDERFDVVEVGGGRWTVSDYMGRMGLEEPLRAGATWVSRFSEDARQEEFAAAVRALAPVLLAALPHTRFVLHQAWYTARSADPAVPFYASAPYHVEWCNRRLAGHYAVLQEVFGARVHVVEAPRELLVGDPAHRWGLAHYHYVPAYYADVLAQLERVADGPVLPGPGAARPTAEPPETRFTGAVPRPVAASAGPQRRQRPLRRVTRAVRRRLGALRRRAHRR
jgi:hypothetical protein